MGKHSFKPSKVTVKGRISQVQAVKNVVRLIEDYPDPADLKAALEELPDDERMRAVMGELMSVQVAHQISIMVAKQLSQFLDDWGYSIETINAVSDDLSADLAEEVAEAERERVAIEAADYANPTTVGGRVVKGL